MNTNLLILEMKKVLRNLDHCLGKGAEHAAAKKYDPTVLLHSRLAPDMFPLVRQVQTACDTAKFAASRLTGKEAPSFPDTEATIDELRARIAATVSYLDGFAAADFADLEGKTLSLPRWEGRTMTLVDYFVEHAVPNFFFHAATTYAILRHNGVDVGKRDFLGALTMQNPA